MIEYQLKTDANGNVRYLMKQKGANVAGKMAYAQAVTMIGCEMPYVTEEFEEYPLTSDGVYFFGAMYRILEDEDTVELGADGLPMPAGAEKPRRKKRTKDIVCE